MVILEKNTTLLDMFYKVLAKGRAGRYISSIRCVTCHINVLSLKPVIGSGVSLLSSPLMLSHSIQLTPPPSRKLSWRMCVL